MKLLLLLLVAVFSQSAFSSDLQLANTKTIKSQELNEAREVYIRLPNNYESSDAQYPVIYLLHGQWDLLSAASTLDLLDSKIPSFILVAIKSSGRELRPAEAQRTSFDNFLVNEVKPFVESNYRVAKYSILSGHSNAGRFVLNQWLGEDHSFSAYFAFSPSLDDNYILDLAKSTEKLRDRPPLRVTLANEGEHMSTPFNSLTTLIGNQTHQSATFANESHNSTKHPSLKFALTSTFPNWEASYEVKTAGFDRHIQHFTDLSREFGFKAEPPMNSLVKLTAYYAIQNDTASAVELKKYVQYMAKKPDGIDDLFEVVDYFSNNDMKPTAKSLTALICQQKTTHGRCSKEYEI